MKTSKEHRYSVAVAGAGLAGLCLAQGLVRDGFDVQVFERDSSPRERRQGYRITVDEHGASALKQCLPPHLYEAVIATASTHGDVGYFRLTNEKLDELYKFTFQRDPGGPRGPIGQVDRSTLRTILLSGIEDRVHFGKPVDHVEFTQDGAVLHLADGSKTEASIVVGADGIHSRLRRQLLPDCPVIDTHVVGIYGKTLLSRAESLLLQLFENSGVMAMGARPGRAVFFTSMRFNEPPKAAFARLVKDQTPSESEDYIMWAVLLRDTDAPDNLFDLASETLHGVALQAAAGYHEALRSLVERAEAEFTVAIRLSAMTKPGSWAASRATLVGDAVHAMPPTGAQGGNTALRDAALLSKKLSEAVARGRPLEWGIDAYQREMLDYAFQEVDKSTRMLNRIMGGFQANL